MWFLPVIIYFAVLIPLRHFIKQLSASRLPLIHLQGQIIPSMIRGLLATRGIGDEINCDFLRGTVMQCHSMLRLNFVPTGPEELPVQPLCGGGSEDPHGDGSHLYRHSKVKLQRRKAAPKIHFRPFSNAK